MARVLGVRSSIVAPARGPRRDVRRAHARDHRLRAGASPSRISRSPRISRAAPRSRSTTRASTASSTTSRTRCSRACCRARSRSRPAAEVVARYRPAGEGAEVGGDFYDSWQTGDHYFLAIGDVAGHGPAAAALTSLTRQTMRVVSRYEQSPSRILAVVNDTIRAQTAPEQFCTAVARGAPADRDGYALTVSCAGHPPPRGRARRRRRRGGRRLRPAARRAAEREFEDTECQLARRRPRRVLDRRRDRAPARGRHVRRGCACRRCSATLAGRPAADVAREIDEAVMDFAPGLPRRRRRDPDRPRHRASPPGSPAARSRCPPRPQGSTAERLIYPNVNE